MNMVFLEQYIILHVNEIVTNSLLVTATGACIGGGKPKLQRVLTSVYATLNVA